MAAYSYPAPKAPNYTKPNSVEDCITQARIFAKKVHGRAALGPVEKGDKILIVTYADQDEYIRDAMLQALIEEGAETVDFLFTHELTGKEQVAATGMFKREE